MIAKTARWICLLCLVTAGYAYGAKPFYGTITKIIDGDSMVITTRTKNIEVRLYGVDCPEYNQPFSAEARHFSNTSVYGRRVLVTPYYYDTYGRMVSLVMQGDTSLNNELVRAGLAWVYPRYCRKSFCKVWKEDEQDAKKQKRGLWNPGDAVSPWGWKRSKHDG
ncbi:MAG: thermonuclease family protein [Desulforhopalus sp.]